MSAAVKHVLIGGGSGFVGKHLGRMLKNNGYGVTIVSRMPGPQRISWEELAISGLPANTNAVISLAGQNVLDLTKRWTPGFKQNVWASRVNTTTALVQASLNSEQKPDVFVSISGVGMLSSYHIFGNKADSADYECFAFVLGVYNPSPSEEYNEDSAVKEFDFLSGLCIAWECAANKAYEASIRTVIIRSGIVLGKDGGMIKQLWLPFFMGLGGPIGRGNQYLPWIHIDDLVSLIIFSIENENINGVLNGVAPDVITNKDFSVALAKAMCRPALLRIPTFVLNLALHEERAKMMTEGQKVIPKKTLESGFQFKYPKIDLAIQQIVGKEK